jgi:hypothetical protein
MRAPRASSERSASTERKRGAPGSEDTIDALVAAARADRVYSVLRPYLEALA